MVGGLVYPCPVHTLESTSTQVLSRDKEPHC